MSNLRKGALVALTAVAASAMFASTAAATPSKTSRCNGCHSGPNVPVTATLASTSGTTATYNASAPGADYIAVFDGTTKVQQISGASGQFSVATGKTYTLYSVAGPGTSDGLGTTSVSPVAATPSDVTAPVTTSNAQASYVSLAAITLSATDAGTGVASTYYRLDGGAQTAGTNVAVNTLGTHTLQFWSVDKAGNTEAAKTVTFTVTAPVPVDTTAPATVSDAAASYVSNATIKLTATDAGSGVASTYYRLDGGAQVAGTSVAVNTVGTHTLQFWSVDKAGNTEVAKTVTFTITAPAPVDTTAPVTTSDAVASYVSNATIKLTATDAGTGVATTYYRLDGGAQVAGTSVTVNAVGTHTLQFWSVDKAGNAEAARTASFVINAAPVPPTSTEQTATTISLRSSSRYTRVGRTIAFSGALAPAQGGEAVSLYVMKPGSDNWTLVTTRSTALSLANIYLSHDDDDDERDDDDAPVVMPTRTTFSFTYRPAARGTYRFQVRFAGDAEGLASASRITTVRAW